LSADDLVGQTFTDAGYGSTSALAHRAFSKNVQLRIVAPEGTTGAWLGPTTVSSGGSYSGGISAHSSEFEFLLSRGSSFKIVKAESIPHPWGEEVYGRKWVLDVIVQQPLDPLPLP
jgi:hypothetical protein